MARLIGDDGSITLPSGHGGVMRTWSAAARYVTSEVTGFVDTRNRRFRRGLPLIEGSATGVPDGGGVADPGVGSTGGTGGGSGSGGATMTLTAIAGSTWTFTGLITAIGLSMDKVGDATQTFDFTNGNASDLAEAWS